MRKGRGGSSLHCHNTQGASRGTATPLDASSGPPYTSMASSYISKCCVSASIWNQMLLISCCVELSTASSTLGWIFKTPLSCCRCWMCRASSCWISGTVRCGGIPSAKAATAHPPRGTSGRPSAGRGGLAPAACARSPLGDWTPGRGAPFVGRGRSGDRGDALGAGWGGGDASPRAAAEAWPRLEDRFAAALWTGAFGGL